MGLGGVDVLTLAGGFGHAGAAEPGDGDAPATCWRPPRPAQPGPINELFRPGVRVTDGYHPEMTVVEPCRVGTLCVPGGLLAVSGPDADDGDGPRITVPVPPGEYVLDEARVRFSYPCESWDAESAWAYDEHGRRTAEAELRLRDDEGRLLIRRLLVRRYPDGQTAEFDVHCPRTAVELSADGAARISHQPEGMRGASLEAEVSVAEEDLWSARPDFDDWPALPVADALPDRVAAKLVSAASGWRREPSRLRGSTDFDRVFRPGTHIGDAPVAAWEMALGPGTIRSGSVRERPSASARTGQRAPSATPRSGRTCGTCWSGRTGRDHPRPTSSPIPPPACTSTAAAWARTWRSSARAAMASTRFGWA
ncbi:hypothetical protein VR46_18785, partial [Streptomyces sp. NRRL S-444]